MGMRQLDGLFTDGLCTAAAITKLLRQLMLKVGEGDFSLQFQRFLQFFPVFDKTDGTVIDCIQFAEWSLGGYFVNDIAEVEDWQDGQFYEGLFGSVTEGRFVVKQDADSRCNFGLEMLNMSLEVGFSTGK